MGKVTKAKNKNKTYSIELSNRRRININSYYNKPWIHVTDEKKGNHVTFDKKDFKKMLKESPKILQYIKKLEGKVRTSSKKKKETESENSESEEEESSEGEESS